MRKPTRHKYIFTYYSFISCNIPRAPCPGISSVVYLTLQCMVFWSLSLSLACAASAEESVVDLLATIKQNWCCDDGLESLTISVEVVLFERTTAQQTMNHCLEVEESRPHPS